jgi:hypothetical protein
LRFVVVAKEVAPEAKPRRESRPKLKNDPKLVAAARELRDRWLEQVNATPVLAQGKYDVSRQREAHSTTVNAKEIPPLERRVNDN